MSTPLLSINYSNITNRAIAAYPVTYGVPLVAGALTSATPLCMRLPNGALRPVQSKVLETHADGSAKWLLLDFSVPLAPNETGQLEVLTAAAPSQGAVSVEDGADSVKVNTPRLRATFNKREFSLFAAYEVDGRGMVLPGSDLILEDTHGKRFYASLSQKLACEIIESGPQRAVVQVTGRHTAEDDSELLTFRVRYTFRPHAPGVQISYKFTNLEAPETGVHLGAIQLVLPTALGNRTEKFVRQTNHGTDWFSRRLPIRENVDLRAGSSLSQEAKTRYGNIVEGKIQIRNLHSLHEDLAAYPYFLRPGNARTDMSGGLRQMYPYLGCRGAGGSAVGWFFEMENNYPKGVLGERNVMTFDIWPHWAGEFHLRRGQSKEHDLYVALTPEALSHEALEAIYFDHELVGLGILSAGGPPLELTLDADYVRSCEALDLHRWLPYDEARYFAIEAKIGTLGAKGALPNKGMMDVGDFVSADRSWCRNNENDNIIDDLREYYRRAEPTMLQLALTRARHNAHVDFIAYDTDPLRQGTMPAHCPEHTDGASYSSHMWVEGLMAAYDVSGNTDFLDAALAVGESLLRWQRDKAILFYADSRECGWPMLAWMRLYQFDRDPRWLEACEAVYQFYRHHMNEDGEIKYALPHGVGTVLQGYGEFITWRVLFYYWEITGKAEVKDFLTGLLDRVYLRRPDAGVVGWGSNDLFPAWAAYALTGDDKYIEDNYPFFQSLLAREGKLPWAGVDMHYYLAELHRRGTLTRFVNDSAH